MKYSRISIFVCFRRIRTC